MLPPLRAHASRCELLRTHTHTNKRSVERTRLNPHDLQSKAGTLRYAFTKFRSWWRARANSFEFLSTKEVYKYFRHFQLCVQNKNRANPEEGEKLDEKTEALDLLNAFLFKSLSAIASSA